MPHSAVEVPHLAFTHHRIGIHTADAAAKTDEKTSRHGTRARARHLPDLPELDEPGLLGLAYWRHHAEGDNSRAAECPPASQGTAEPGRPDAAYTTARSLTALAGLALEENDTARARSHAERALADPAHHRRATECRPGELLSAIYVQENRLADATSFSIN